MRAGPALRKDLAAAFAPAERALPNLLLRQAERHGDRPLARAGEVC